MKKLLLITLTLTSYFVNAQNIQAYSDATIDGRGFSYNVQLSITPLENNEVTQSGGWIVKIISVNPDSKGYYHKGKTDRYFSCSELGSICNPSKFNVILVKVKYQCENNAEKLITFYGLDREQTIVVRQKPNTKCNIELESVTVRNNTDGDIYHKRINELEYPQQNTSTTNNNLPSSNYSNPIAKENKQTSTGMPANTSGNDPLANYNNNSPQKSSFEKGYETGQQIANVTTPLVGAVVDLWNSKIEAKNKTIYDARDENERRKSKFRDDCFQRNELINTWNGFQSIVIKKIPNLLSQPSPTWLKLLGSQKYINVFGKGLDYITENYKPKVGGKNKIKNDIAKGEMSTYECEPDCFSDFYGAYSYIDYPFVYFMDNEILHKDQTCYFIFDENNIVIGIKIEINTYYSTLNYNALPVDKYIQDLKNKMGNNYLQINGNSFLLQDKLIIVNFDSIVMYDLNFLYDKTILNFPKQYLNIEELSSGKYKYKYAGFAWKKNIESSAIQAKRLQKGGIGWWMKDKTYSSWVTSDKGIVVGKIKEGSLIEKAGIKEGDIITELCDMKVKAPYIFQLIMQGCLATSQMNVSYLRDGQEFKTFFVF